MGLGSDEYVLSLVVTASILAIFTVPAWAAALGPLFGRESQLAPGDVAMLIAKSFLAPLAIGMVLRRFIPNKADAIADKVLTVAGLVLAVSALILLISNWQLLVKAGWPALLALALLTLSALIIGHVVGGPEPGEKTALAVSCATRHLGLAILVAAAVPGPKTAVFVAAYIVSSAIVAIPYLKWRTRIAAEQQ